MLREIPSSRQVPGESRRRWFASPCCDLIVWIREEDESAEGFQFCYDKDDHERALTWTRRSGFSHMAVDSGSGFPSHKGTPLLVADEAYDAKRILEIFRAEAPLIPVEYVELVSGKVRELADRSDEG